MPKAGRLGSRGFRKPCVVLEQQRWVGFRPANDLHGRSQDQPVRSRPQAGHSLSQGTSASGARRKERSRCDGFRAQSPIRRLVRAAGVEPARAMPNGFSYHFGFRRRQGRSWSGLSLHRSASALGAARLVSTPSLAGLARDRHLTGFPEFGQFCIKGFPKSTQLV